MSFNHMPNVSSAEGVHIGTRSATSAVRLSSHSKLCARRRNIVLCLLLLSARCVTLDLCPEGRPVVTNLECCNRQSPRLFGVTFCVTHSALPRTYVLIVLAISRISTTPAEHDSGTSIHFAREMAFLLSPNTYLAYVTPVTRPKTRAIQKRDFHPICSCRGRLPQPHLLRSNRRSPLNQIPGQRSSHQFPIHPCRN